MQPSYVTGTRRVELIGDTQEEIIMTSTVPVALSDCNDLTFKYDHHDPKAPGIESLDCVAHFNEERLEHTLKLRVKPTFGCRPYTSLMEFQPYDKPGESMWTGYVPGNITV